MVIEGTKPTGLPVHYLVGVSIVSCRFYSECLSGYRFQIMCRLSRPILLRVTTTMRRTELTGPPECRSSE